MVWPKLVVSNYPEILRKLSCFAFFVCVGCVWLLRAHVPQIDALLVQLDLTPNIPIFGPVTIPFGTFAVAAFVAGLSEAIKLHNRISTFMGTRTRFDVRWILLPMALVSGARLTFPQFERIAAQSQNLMYDVFYKYTSGIPGQAVIDSHNVTQELTNWSWYWLCVETIVFLGITSVLLAYAQQFKLVVIILAIVLLLLLLMRYFWNECCKIAQAEAREILGDPQRKKAIAEIFDAL